MHLELLELTAQELELAHREIEKIAYRKWEQAGRPFCDPLKFWNAAEREWICRYYVPNREIEAGAPG